MSRAGHCRHCPEACCRYKFAMQWDKHHDGKASWEDGHCPACDEAEAIAVLLGREAERAHLDAKDRLTSGYTEAGICYEHAARIARGEQ